jgi:hypothetical protein
MKTRCPLSGQCQPSIRARVSLANSCNVQNPQAETDKSVVQRAVKTLMQLMCHLPRGARHDRAVGEILLQRADSFIDAKGGETKDMLTANENIC